MVPGTDALARLLEQEREAALRADVDTLAELQRAKRLVLDGLARGEVDDGALAELARGARENIALIRHLVHCLAGMLDGAPATTYGAAGDRTSVVPGRSWGVR